MARRAGFTLTEMLVALALFALIGAAGTAVLTAAITNRETASDAARRLSRLQRVEALLRADLGQAVARPPRETDGRRRASPLIGGEGELVVDLVRGGWDSPGETARSPLQRIDYRLIGGRLERRAWPFADGARPGAAMVLHDAVRSARVIFIDRGRETAVWAGSPDHPLPDAVRLELDLDDWGPVVLILKVGP